MKNRGETLRQINNLSSTFEIFTGARPRLKVLMEGTMEMGKHLFHGDKLPHNVAVARSGKMALFDYDEAFRLRTLPPRRVLPGLSSDYRCIAYPNALRGAHKVL